MKVSLLLVALAAGYWVLTLAKAQGKPLDLVGRITGILIMLVAVCGLICSAIFGFCGKKYSCKTGSCAMGMKAGMMHPPGCPMMDTKAGDKKQAE